MTHCLSSLLRRLAPMMLASLLALLMTQSATAQESDTDFERLDLSGNGVVNASDASLVVGAWQRLQQDGECLGVYDSHNVSGAGCVDVTDVQKVLSAWGSSPTTGQLQSDAPEFSTAQSQIFTVNSADDDVADHYCTTPESKCTLRAALRLANLNGVTDEIRFNILNPDGTCPSTTNPVQIRPNSTLAPGNQLLLDDMNGMPTTINGFSQCGASANTLAVGGNANIRIEIVGKAKEPSPDRAYTYQVPGLSIVQKNNVVRGLAVYGWDSSIQIAGSNAANNTLEGNFIGTNALHMEQGGSAFNLNGGDFRMPDGKTFKIKEGDGVRIESFAQNTTVGGPAPSQRNVVAGAWDGIALEWRVLDTRIYNNYVGLKQDGITPWGNAADGVDVNSGARGTRIGGQRDTSLPDPAYRNVISGNYSDGIEVAHSPWVITDTTPMQTYPTEDTYIAGNYIGVTAWGGPLPWMPEKNALWGGNGSNGITLEDAVREVFIRGNVISGNGDNGVRLWSRITDSEISNNYIGVGPDGSTPLPNGVSLDPYDNYSRIRKGRHGVYIVGSSKRNKVINNIIANNKGYGVLISNGKTEYATEESEPTRFNTLSRNTIYNNGDWAYFNSIPKPPREFPYNEPELHNGIKFKDQARELPNQGIPSPWINSAYTNMVRGTAKNGAGENCAGCLVEVFAVTAGDRSASMYGQSYRFVGSAITDSGGRFVVGVSGLTAGDFVTATTTDTAGNTSEEARNVQVQSGSDPGGGTPGPTPTLPPAPTPPPTSVPPTPEPTTPVRLYRKWIPLIEP